MSVIKNRNLGCITVADPQEKPYLITGHRMYLIGSQDGRFVKGGAHIPHEMYGLWVPPVKVMEGFRLLVDGQPVSDAVQFEMLPYACIFKYELQDGVTCSRSQWVAQEEKALVVEFTFTNDTDADYRKQLGLEVVSHLMPTWLSERLGIRDGEDYGMFEQESGLLYFCDRENPWTLCVGMSERPAEASVEAGQEKNTCRGILKTELLVPAHTGKTVTVVFAASEQGKTEAENICNYVSARKEELLQKKIAVYEAMEDKASLEYPAEPKFAEMYRWTRYINDWIIREVDGVGRGVAAGYPEFPWWFGNDTNYIAPALLMQGEYEICKETLRLVRRKSEEVNGNGRVVHEISNNGVVYYEGMSTETPQFADTVWMIYTFDGDKEFLEEMYDFCRQGVGYMESICQDGLPRGYGICEVAGLDCYCCDTAVLFVRGYEIMANMAEALGRTEDAEMYRAKQRETWEIFQREFYMPEYGFYGDMVATKEEIMERAASWKISLKSFPITEEDEILSESSCKQDKFPEDEVEKQRLKDRMDGILESAAKLSAGERRPYYLFGLDHTRTALEFGYLDSGTSKAMRQAMDEHKKKEPTKIENMMPIGVGREIAGLGYIHDPEGIVEKIREVADGFSTLTPGATSEIYPDSGCFVQAWNSLATMWPYFGSIFGIRPDAAGRKVLLHPCLCESMTGMKLTNVRLGGQSLSFVYEGNKTIRVTLPDATWKAELSEDRKEYKLEVEYGM